MPSCSFRASVALVLLVWLAACGSGGGASGGGSDAGGGDGSDAGGASDASISDAAIPDDGVAADSGGGGGDAAGEASTGDDASFACDGSAAVGDAGACFTTGLWHIDNLEPCFLSVVDDAGASVDLAYASAPGNPPTCAFDMNTGQPTLPPSWSTDTLTVDCAGAYSLCYTLQAGTPGDPKPTDCVLAKVCTQVTPYTTPGVAQSFAPLPAWQTTPAQQACVDAFQQTGGTGLMSVEGESSGCAAVSRTFQTVTYCPVACGGSCASCAAGGGGSF